MEQEHLWPFLKNKKIAGTLKIHIPRSKERRAKEAIMDIRFSEVSLTPPKDSGYPPIKAWAIYALESEPEEGQAPIEWMLLTTAEVYNLEDARQKLGTADQLKTCLGVDMVVAWRIYHLTMLGREVPEHPCTVFFEDIEWKALWCYYTKNTEPPEKPPALGTVTRMVGITGGHLWRKRDGMPGTECLWRELQRLATIVEMYAIFKHIPLPRKQFCPYAIPPPPEPTAFSVGKGQRYGGEKEDRIGLNLIY